MAAILVYETKRSLTSALCSTIEKMQHTPVRCDPKSIPGADLLARKPLVILDSETRWTYCRPLLEAFAAAGCAVLFLTGNPTASVHLQKLYNGTASVLSRPFSEEDLSSRIQLLMSQQTEAHQLTLMEDERLVMLDGHHISLTAQEYALLSVLYENHDQPVSREQLLREAWGYQSMGETRTVDVHVQRLRRKLKSAVIETVYKYGYRLNLE